MWKLEIMHRPNYKILVIYYKPSVDEIETRGSVEVHSDEELEKWKKVIEKLNKN